MIPTGSNLDELLARLAEAALRPEDSLVGMRAANDAYAARLPQPAGIEIRSEPGLSCRAEWLIPTELDASGSDRVVLYLHGGGYILGSLVDSRPFGGLLARAARAPVLSLDYRLAPEHPFPAAVHDAGAAVGWLLDRGHDPARVTIAGDSAGGGLAIATLLALRDRGRPLPGAGVCISPWADLTLPAGSLDVNERSDPQIARWLLTRMAEAYLGDVDPRHPWASPVLADLSGLPPLLIQVGGAECLLDDANALGDRAAACGVDVTVQVWDGMFHVWPAFAPELPEAVAAWSATERWLAGHG